MLSINSYVRPLDSRIMSKFNFPIFSLFFIFSLTSGVQLLLRQDSNVNFKYKNYVLIFLRIPNEAYKIIMAEFRDIE